MERQKATTHPPTRHINRMKILNAQSIYFMNTRTIYCTVNFFALTLVLAACSKQPDPVIEFDGTPAELIADIADFKKSFNIKISDVNRELGQLQALIQAEKPSAEADSLSAAAKLEKAAQIHSQLTRLAGDLFSLDVASDSAYLSKRMAFEKSLNEIVTQIEVLRLNSLDNRAEFENVINVRLHELDLELMDMQRRIGRIDTPIQADFTQQLNVYKRRYADLTETFDTLDSASTEAFMALRISLTKETTGLGTEVRATTNELLRLSSGSWKLLHTSKS